MVTKMMKLWFAIKGCIVDGQFQCEVVSTVTEGGGVSWSEMGAFHLGAGEPGEDAAGSGQAPGVPLTLSVEDTLLALVSSVLLFWLWTSWNKVICWLSGNSPSRYSFS